MLPSFVATAVHLAKALPTLRVAFLACPMFPFSPFPLISHVRASFLCFARSGHFRLGKFEAGRFSLRELGNHALSVAGEQGAMPKTLIVVGTETKLEVQAQSAWMQGPVFDLALLAFAWLPLLLLLVMADKDRRPRRHSATPTDRIRSSLSLNRR